MGGTHPPLSEFSGSALDYLPRLRRIIVLVYTQEAISTTFSEGNHLKSIKLTSQFMRGKRARGTKHKRIRNER